MNKEDDDIKKEPENEQRRSFLIKPR